MNVSSAGRRAIAQREGNVLTAYRDSVGVLTIGVGHTSMAGPPDVRPGMKISKLESDAILTRDLGKFEHAVLDAVKVPLEQHEFDALVSLAFNIGPLAFAKSSVVREVNKGNKHVAADKFLLWKNAGGKPILLKRRQAERAQFLGA